MDWFWQEDGPLALLPWLPSWVVLWRRQRAAWWLQTVMMVDEAYRIHEWVLPSLLSDLWDVLVLPAGARWTPASAGHGLGPGLSGSQRTLRRPGRPQAGTHGSFGAALEVGGAAPLGPGLVAAGSTRCSPGRGELLSGGATLNGQPGFIGH
jgi:hypothetical protein